MEWKFWLGVSLVLTGLAVIGGSISGWRTQDGIAMLLKMVVPALAICAVGLVVSIRARKSQPRR